MSLLDLSDESLAEKFRREFSEQFQILVRMHLSFVLDLNTDDSDSLSDKNKYKKWKLAPFSKKIKSIGIMDGAPLTQEGICQVYQLIEFLKNENNVKVEGIFRRTGSIARQQDLRNLLNQGVTIDLESGNFSVHDCASVLKGFLSDLPDPLLTEAHFPAYCQIAELCQIKDKPTQEAKLLEALQLILLLLPSENKGLLKDLLDLLHLTASHEKSNKMSPENLATLFTPHLLCPRKLTPEQLHFNSQNLCRIVTFMIRNIENLFKIPQKLVVDFRARFEKRTLQPNKFNESVNDKFAASTVFSFVDHELTAKENEKNPTETALAQLYAYIQSLPESSKKRKLVKQFNKENGYGTPLQIARSNNMAKSRGLGDSIKKHIFSGGLMRSKKSSTKGRSSSEEILNTPPNSNGLIARARLFCTNCESSNELNNQGESAAKKAKLSSSSEMLDEQPLEAIELSDRDLRRSFSEPDLSGDIVYHCPNIYLTSTPACVAPLKNTEGIFTPESQDSKAMSPITRSAQRMPKAMQETMMTPRSRKPVLLVSGTNLTALPKMDGAMSNLEEETSENMDDSSEKISLKESSCEVPHCDKDVSKSDSLTSTFRNYLTSRDMLTCSLNDNSFSSRTDDFTSNDFCDISENKLSSSLLNCLDGNEPFDDDMAEEKEPILKPRDFDEHGKPIVFETSF